MKLSLAVAMLLALSRAAPPEPVTWSLALDPAPGTFRIGGALTAVVTARLEQGWHVYGVDDLPGGPRPLRVVVPPNGAFAARGALKCPEPERDMDEAFSQVTMLYRDNFTCRQAVTAAPGAVPGRQTLAVEISFQACDGRMCLPPRIVRLTKAVTLTR